MVIPDWSASKRPPKIEITQEKALRFARPLDRLAAAIIDFCILLTPTYLLLSAPLKRNLTTSFILNSDPDLFVLGVSLLLMAAIVIMAYQTLSLFWFGTTAGKRVLGVEVVPVFGSAPLALWDCFIRSLIFTLEVLCLGLPWLAVFSNERRRPLHDRAADTVVVTRSALGVSTPTLVEQGLVRGIFATCLALLALVTFIEVRGTAERMRIEHAFLSVSDREIVECEAVSQHMEEDTEADHTRLNMAMSLYAAGLVDRPCLESEVEREVALQTPIGSVTYLAQAFVYADDAEVSNSYLDKVCEDAPEAVECAMSQLVTAWSDEDWGAVEQVLRSAPKGSGYLEVWGVRHYMKQAQYAHALQMLDALGSRRELANFSLVQRVKALFNSFRDNESQVALQQAVVALPDEDREDVSAWMCVQQLQNGCAALEGAACTQVKLSGETQFTTAPAALAQVMARECNATAQVDYLKLSDEAKDENWQAFFRANLKRQREDRSAAAALFAKVIQAEGTPEPLRIEAVRRWLQFATPRQMEEITALWNGFSSKEAWVKTGNLLFARLAETKNPELAMKVARHLMNWDSLSPKGFNQLSAMMDTAPSQRKPASAEKIREHVKQVLDSLEGGK
ncbi:MAG: RDD family protein [Bdellovibrionales bacterium]|nr:RDD family protein [Bdellovibrionales bacterium]